MSYMGYEAERYVPILGAGSQRQTPMCHCRPIGHRVSASKYLDTNFTPLCQRGAGGISGHDGKANPPYPLYERGQRTYKSFCPGT
jgi:hypothetical protein